MLAEAKSISEQVRGDEIKDYKLKIKRNNRTERCTWGLVIEYYTTCDKENSKVS